MDYKEALRILNILRETGIKLGEGQIAEAVKVGIGATEFRIGAKPFGLERKFRKTRYTCGYCGSFIGYGKDAKVFNYCPKCGQRIDWT